MINLDEALVLLEDLAIRAQADANRLLAQIDDDHAREVVSLVAGNFGTVVGVVRSIKDVSESVDLVEPVADICH